VKAAAAAVVAAFARHDRDAYFDTFAPECTFLFYNAPALLADRAAYETEWDLWTKDGFHVLGCESSNGQVTMVSDTVGIFTHTVRTTLAEGEGSIVTGELETIVFALRDGRWLGVHEHLSSDPTYTVG
jgi:ketosteroid isomerase-like protein